MTFRGAATMARSRLGQEHGFALPLALFILMIVAMLAGAAVLFATHGTNRATRDQASARAFAAADAGLDIATWRINKLVAPEVLTGASDTLGGDVQLRGCVNLGVDAGPLAFSVAAGSGAGWCAAESGEVVDEGEAVPAEYTYWLEVMVAPGSGIIRRRVISMGKVGDVVRRIQATLELDAEPTDPLALFERFSYVECTAEEPPANDPAAGCPS